MSRKTVQFKLPPAGPAPAAPAATADAWVARAAGPPQEAPASDPPAREEAASRAPAPEASDRADPAACGAILARGLLAMPGELAASHLAWSRRTGAGMERLLRCRTYPDVARAQADLARAQVEHWLGAGARLAALYARAAGDAARSLDVPAP
jgi:hypothetical protein